LAGVRFIGDEKQIDGQGLSKIQSQIEGLTVKGFSAFDFRDFRLKDP
jgi:hypothetical protein